MPNVTMALVHHPVKNRNGKEIAAQTNEFDIMDASRLVHVYDVKRLYIVQPIEAQARVIDEMIRYQMDPDRAAQRGRFMKSVRTDSLAEALQHAEQEDGQRPMTVVTTANEQENALAFATLRQRIEAGEHLMVLFGKAWGLTADVIDSADLCLEPVSGGTGFDHLPVRSAFAIVLDRLLGVR